MPDKYTLKFDYDLKKFFEEQLAKQADIRFNNVAEYLKSLIISHKKDLEEDLYNLKINNKIIEFFDDFIKDNPNLGYINGDEYLREFIRSKAEEITQSKKL